MGTKCHAVVDGIRNFFAKKLPCRNCGKPTLPATKKKTGGLCFVCWDLQHIPSIVHPAISTIASEEIKRGNRIVSVKRSATKQGGIRIEMKDKFKDKYDIDSKDLEYTTVRHSDDCYYYYNHKITHDAVYSAKYYDDPWSRGGTKAEQAGNIIWQIFLRYCLPPIVIVIALILLFVYLELYAVAVMLGVLLALPILAATLWVLKTIIM
ncbi:hypothetical protein DI392_11410 [Vibrio albus]|uniref:Uncharacterized protein n=1 Tax=Vibrio albus TaxID=2200953 RepID=A0A2U3B9P2_9VIBR|nr:hypothetical protein [Vibrio albus]PWI33445.1 hypothetical protein DI392_11410 [Vibrio albus]